MNLITKILLQLNQVNLNTNLILLKKDLLGLLITKLENKMIKTMKRGSRIMITGYNQKGSQTIDHYSLLGFTKAYNAAKTSCS